MNAHIINCPVPGLFRTRTHSGGPWVAAIIWAEPAHDPETHAVADRAPTLRCAVHGEERDPVETWTWLHDFPPGADPAEAYQALVRETADLDLDDDPEPGPTQYEVLRRMLGPPPGELAGVRLYHEREGRIR